MKPTTADELPSHGPSASPLQLLGEVLAATASLDRLGRLVTREVRDASGASRVALLVRDERGRLRSAGDVTRRDGGAPAGHVVALPLIVRAAVEGIVVVQDVADRAALDGFLPPVASAVGAVRATQTGGDDGAATRARITGQILHEVNNRLGAIQIYAYLLTERLKRGQDTGGLEIAGKLCGAVERLGTSIGSLASDAPAAGERAPVDLDTLVDGCLGKVTDDLAASGVLARPEPGAVGTVLVHEASLLEALRHLLRELGSMDGARIGVTTERLPPRAVAIAIDTAVGMQRVSDAIFAGESDELGRALLRDVVERQGGTVSVRRTGEDGARIHLELASGAE